jgi:hypothetical protein
VRYRNLVTFLLSLSILGCLAYFGMGVYHTYTENSNRDQLISTLYDIGLNAQDHYNKSPVSEGGAKNFINWVLPDNYLRTENGSFAAISSRNKVNMTAIGNQIGRNGITNVRVNAIVDSAGIWVTVIN